LFVLEGFLKNENELLRSANLRFQEEIKELKVIHKKTGNLVRKWFGRASRLRARNQRLQVKIQSLQSTNSGLEVLAHETT
jgi:hypothetical protein